jgi:hypothetical protein
MNVIVDAFLRGPEQATRWSGRVPGSQPLKLEILLLDQGHSFLLALYLVFNIDLSSKSWSNGISVSFVLTEAVCGGSHRCTS